MIQIGFLLLICIAAVTSAPAPAPDSEPTIETVSCVNDVVPVNNLNAALFSGIWYEVRNFFPLPGRKGKCGAAKYTDNKDGTLRVNVGWVDTQNAVQKRSGIVKHASPKATDAQLAVTLQKQSLTYIIFYLAYDKFFGVYACVNNKADVWIFARQREVRNVTLQGSIYTVMRSKYPRLSTTIFSVTNQKDCPAVV